MQGLFQRSGVTDGAPGASQSTVGDPGGGGGGQASHQIDEFRSVVEQLRKENPTMSITAIRQMAIKQMTQDRLNWSANASSSGGGSQGGQQGNTNLMGGGSQSLYPGRDHASSSLAAMGDSRRRSYISEKSGSGDEQPQSILDAVRKAGQDAINTIRQGGALEEEIDERKRVLMRRESDRDLARKMGDVDLDSDEESDSSDYSDSDDDDCGRSNAAESMRSLRSTRSIEAEKRAKKQKKKKKSSGSPGGSPGDGTPMSISVKKDKTKKKKKKRPDGTESTRSMLSINEQDTTYGTHDASASVRSRQRQKRRSSYTGKCAATSMKSISENYPDEEGASALNVDYQASLTGSGSQSGGSGRDVTRSERSLKMEPGELVCSWKQRRASTGSYRSSDDSFSNSHNSGMTFDDSYGDGSLICGFGARGGGGRQDSMESIGEAKEAMKELKSSLKSGSAPAASSRKKTAAKNPYLQF